MARKIAVLIRDRQEEALRMALGLTLADDRVDVYVLDRPMAWSRRSREYAALMAEMGIGLFSNHPHSRRSIPSSNSWGNVLRPMLTA